MRLIVCVKRDLHGCGFLNRLLPRLSNHQVHVLLADKTRPAECSIPELSELAYLERGLPLQRLFPLLDQMPAAAAEWATFAGLEKRHGLRCERLDDINAPATLSALQTFAPDLIISARFSYIFKPAAIATARFGVLNVHPGELPAYAGLFAPMRTIAEGGRDLVCCLHFIDAGIDSGPIIDMQRLPYRKDLGLLTQTAEIYPLAITPLLDLIDRLERGTGIRAAVQDRRQRRYWPAPSAAEVNAFLAAGHRLWTAQGYDDLLARFLPNGQGIAAPEAAGRFGPGRFDGNLEAPLLHR